MPQLLTGNALLPRKIVVEVHAEVGVIQLGVALSDVVVRIDGYPRDTQPTVLSVRQVADTNLSTGALTLAADLLAGTALILRHTEFSGQGPFRKGHCDVAIPVAGGAVDDRQIEGTRRPSPVISSPRVISVRGASQKGAKAIDAADRNFLVTIIASKLKTYDFKIAEFATRHHAK